MNGGFFYNKWLDLQAHIKEVVYSDLPLAANDLKESLIGLW